MNKKLNIRTQDDHEEKEDRLSSLPDELIHQIQSFLGTRQAVQTSILSKRWKHIWCTLPFLNLDWYDQLFPYTHSSIIKFMENVFLKRNHQARIFSFKLYAVYPFPPSFLRKLVNDLNEQDVEELDIDLDFHRYSPFKLSTFNLSCVKKLKLRAPLDFSESLESVCLWNLPVLTTLHLICPPHMPKYKLPESCLICLPALTTLCLDRVELPGSLSSFSLPITSLSMKRCQLPETVWDFPALTSLELDDVIYTENKNDYFSALVTLRNLTLNFSTKFIRNFFISCPQLVNLTITTPRVPRISDIVVVAPKLREFSCVGIFEITLNVHELENVNFKLRDPNEFKDTTMAEKKVVYSSLVRVFSKLGGAKILTIDLDTFEALCTISDLFKLEPSPFRNLRYVKLPHGYKESSISSALEKYLLGGNPRATIVTALPQINVNHQAT